MINTKAGIASLMAGALSATAWGSAQADQPPQTTDAEPTVSVHLQWTPTEIHKSLSYYYPGEVNLTPEKPAGLKKAPADLVDPLYGQLKLGPKEASATYLIILDEPAKGPACLFIDRNGNGDLTDDPKVSWTGAGGMYKGNVTFSIPYADGARDGQVCLYHLRQNDPMAIQQKITNKLFYCANYGWTGTVQFSGKTMSAALINESNTGDFRPPVQHLAALWLDANGDGKVSAGETYNIDKPFNIGGTTWELAGITADGTFKIVKSAQTVAERPIAPDLSPGHASPLFTAQTTDGKPVNFPGDYKGKLLLVDFWATWCGPCMAEVPNVAKNYAAYHAQGLDVLGISLDSAVDAKFNAVLKQQNMTWPQICDGKSGESPVVKLYGIEGIPHILLLDGDTGKILADDLRGDTIGKAIATALAKRNKASL